MVFDGGFVELGHECRSILGLVIMCTSWCGRQGQHVFDQTDHHVLVPGVGLGHQQRQRRQPHVVDDRRAVADQAAIAGQEIHE